MFQEENRLKAKALRERSLAAERENASATIGRTPSGFIASQEISGRKRAHDSTGAPSNKSPQTVRDARRPIANDDIHVARKFKKYVDHDFSKMTDTKGGFLSVEDDPFNKALHAPEKEGGKPAHMTLKEWERHQLTKSLQRRKEGPFEPGLGLDKTGKKCRECKSLEIDWQWDDVFGVSVCHKCKEILPNRYSLLTKTEAKDDYLLTDREFLSGVLWSLLTIL
jgi:DNA-repair protein complementing XP-A cells